MTQEKSDDWSDEAILHKLKLRHYQPTPHGTTELLCFKAAELIERLIALARIGASLTPAPGAKIAAHVAPITEALKVKDYYVDDYYGKVFGGPSEIDWGPDVGREIVGAATGAGEEGEMVENEKLRTELGVIIDRAQEWCDAVDRGSSWDYWDHHFKEMKYNILPKARAAIKGGK